MADPTRLDDAAVRERLARLDELLAQVEATPGPAGELALDAVSTLAEVYGEALARAVGHAADAPAVVASFTRDELLGHLLVLHDAHPDPVEQRVARAVDEVRAAGGDVELTGIDGGVASIQLRTKGCGSAGIEDAVRDAVMAVAPELADVRRVPAEREAAFVPVDALLQRPATP